MRLPEAPAPPGSVLQVLRRVQEAGTHALRHAGATRLTVRVLHDAQGLLVHVHVHVHDDSGSPLPGCADATEIL